MRDERHILLDDSIHAYLDGELDPAETAAIARLIRERPNLRRKVAALQGMQEWGKTARPEFSADAAERLRKALAAEMDSREHENARAVAEASLTLQRSEPPAGLRRLAGVRQARWRWAAAATLLAALVLMATRTGVLRPRLRPAPHSPGEQLVRHEFTILAPNAREVCLVGEFNMWTVCDTPLTRVEGGTWSVTLELLPGRYEYQFVIDGQWVTDPNAANRVPDGYGRHNAVALLWRPIT